ncbi:MAG TPA: cation:proton antiporter, partial [Noviherbaspirillum sp.]
MPGACQLSLRRMMPDRQNYLLVYTVNRRSGSLRTRLAFERIIGRNRMMDLLPVAADLAWPIAVAIAWIAGEFGHRWTGLPRISIYGITGFILGQSGLLAQSGRDAVMLLANVAFGLILFEFGYRINLRWLRLNPWLTVTGVVESVGTFIAVYLLAQWFGVPIVAALLLASLAMSTSPAAVLRIVNEARSSGQVTERALHLSALDCVLAVFA